MLKFGGFFPPMAVLGAWIYWTADSGGYQTRAWYPVALGLLMVLAAVWLRHRGQPYSPGPGRAASACFVALTAWSFASMIWAVSAWSAWQAANQLLLYVVIAAIVWHAPWTARSASVFIGVWALGVGALCATSLLEAVRASDLTDYLVASRYSEPVGYSNGTAAVAASAFIPAFVLGSQRAFPAILQVVFLANAAFLLEFCLLARSRGAMAALAAACLVLIVLLPDRTRALLRLSLLIAAAAGSIDPILRGLDTANAAGVGEALGDTALRVGVTSALVGTAAVALLLMEPHHAGLRGRATLRAASAAVALVSLLIGGTVLARIDYREALARIDNRETVRAALNPSGLRAVGKESIADPRLPIWRDATALFLASPIIGIGAGNFDRARTSRFGLGGYQRYVHSIFLRMLSELGVVGLGLFLGFVAACIGGLRAVHRRAGAAEKAIVAVGASLFTYFLLHASIDWLDELPAVAAPAFGLVFVALALSPSDSHSQRSTRDGRRVRRTVWLGAGSAIFASTFVSLALPYVSTIYTDRAFERASKAPAEAWTALRSAAAANPLSPQPKVAEGTIAVGLGRYKQARGAFNKTLTRDESWYAHLELALLEAEAGRFRAAQGHNRSAVLLGASPSLVQEVHRRTLRKERIDPRAFNNLIPGLVTHEGTIMTSGGIPADKDCLVKGVLPC